MYMKRGLISNVMKRSFYAHTACGACAVCLGVHFLPRGKKRTKKARLGALPLTTPARQSRALFGALCRGATALLMRASKILLRANFPSWRHISHRQDGLGGTVAMKFY
jgi:hypothetical protein